MVYVMKMVRSRTEEYLTQEDDRSGILLFPEARIIRRSAAVNCSLHLTK